MYLQWHPYDWVTLTGGKMRNPLYTTDILWDPDINPEGAAEQFSWTFPIGGGSETASARDPKDSKDLKAISAPASESDESLSIGFTAFQGIYADNSETNLSGGVGNTIAPNSDVWQFVEQVPVQFNFNKDTFVKVVPGFDTYMGGGNANTTGGATGNVTLLANSTGSVNNNNLSGNPDGAGTQNFASPLASDNLALITAPGEFDWKFGKIPLKFYWDFVANLDGKSRVQDVYLRPGAPTNATTQTQSAATAGQNSALGDNIAWLAGLQIGQNKKKGDWSARADYRQVGLGAVDPNLNDSDWGDSFLNQQGVKLATTYNFTDFLTGTITAYDTWAYKSGLFAGENTQGLQVTENASGATTSLTGLAQTSQTQRVDVDLQWKF